MTSTAHPAPAALALRERLARHPIATYFALAYGLSWALWLPAALVLEGAAREGAILLGVFGPAAAAAALTRATGGSLRAWLRGLFAVRAPLRFYAAIVLVPVALVAVANGAFVLVGDGWDAGLLAERLAAYPLLLVVWTFFALGEEPGWRGFALPRLLDRFSPVRATVLLGTLWGLWHVPLLAAADEPAHGLAALPLAGVTAATLVAIVGYSFLYTVLWRRTRNVWLAIVLHGSLTAANGAFVLVPSDDQVGATYVTLQLIVTTLLVLVAVGLVRATRGRL